MTPAPGISETGDPSISTSVSALYGPSIELIEADSGGSISLQATIKFGEEETAVAQAGPVIVAHEAPRLLAEPELLEIMVEEGIHEVPLATHFTGARGGSWRVTGEGATIGADGTLSIDPAAFAGFREFRVTYSNPAGEATMVLPVAAASREQWGAIEIRGINVNPADGDWHGETLGLTPARIEALRFAGFNALRVWIDAEPLLSAATREERAAAVDAAVAKVAAAAGDGFRICVQLAPGKATREAFANGHGVAAYADAAAALAGGLGAAFAPAQVMLDLMNEPFEGRGNYEADIVAVWQAARAAAPHLTLGVEARALAYAPNLADLDPTAFDDNTLFVIHGYDPGLLTHQQNYPNLPVIPYPVALYAGGRDQAEADMIASVEAEPELSAVQRIARIAERTKDLDYLFANGGIGRPYIARLLDEVDEWREAHGLSADRILLNEFGFIGVFQWSGTYRYDDLASRARYMGDWRREVEERSYAGWMAYQAMGDFEMFEQTDVRTASNRLLTPIIDALGLRWPIPAAVTDLRISSAGAESVVLSFTAALDATSHEYQLDGGDWTPLSSGGVIAGLAQDTAYRIGLRGRNASAAGPTAELPLPWSGRIG